MPVYDNTRLRDYNTLYGNIHLTNEIESNIIAYLDWGFLGICAFQNVESGVTDAYGGSAFTLKPIKDDNYSDYQVFQGARKNWVYETGIECSTEPIPLTGVYVNGTLYTRDHGTYGYYVNFREGKIVFNNALDDNDVVAVNHSYKNVWIDTNDSVLANLELQYKSERSDDSHFAQYGSGEWSPFPGARIQLPAIGVQVVARRNWKPYQIGPRAWQWCFNDMLFHCYGQTEEECTRLLDILSTNSDHAVKFYDTQQVAAAQKFKLDYRGDLAAGGLVYPDLVSNYQNPHFYGPVTWSDTNIQSFHRYNSNLYIGIVRTQLKFVYTRI